MEKSVSHFSTRQLVVMALFSSLSLVLMFIAFPVIPLVPYMKIDFSDLPILLGMLIYGPVAGIGIAGIKSLLYWVLMGASFPEFIGVATSFIASVTFLLALYYGYKLVVHHRESVRMISAIVAATIALTIVMALLNWLVVTPLYIMLIGLKLTVSLPTLVLFGVVPFNLIKGILIGGLFWLMQSRMGHWVKTQRHES